MAEFSGAKRPRLHDLRLERRHQVIRTDNTRSLLTVVVAEFLLPTGETAWTSTFLEVLGRFGMRPATVRHALARASDPSRPDEMLSSELIGRRKRWRLSEGGERLLRMSASRTLPVAAETEEWDGSWLVVLASVPENERSRRYLIRSRLIWAGLGSPAPGVWVGTHTARLPEVEEALELAGLSDQASVFVARHQHLAQMQSLVAAAWDLDGIAREYQQFIDDFAAAALEDPLIDLVELVAAWSKVVLQDPGLPAELLPASWPRAEAAAVLLDRHQHWRPAALDQWNEINGDQEG